MAITGATTRELAWWREPTQDQWRAWWAGWLGWTLDAFDFTVFLLIMVPVSKEFGVSLTQVTAVLTVTLWMRLVGACASGWLADRVGRKTPLMISIAWYSVCNFIAGFSPSFWFLFLFRALLGIGMGAEWPAGAALAMESWPTRSRGLMSGILIYSSIWSLSATHLQLDLHFSPAQVATPIAIANFLAFLASGFWGWTADRIGRRWAMIIPGIVTVFVAPLYLLTADLTLIVAGFVLQGLFGDALYGQNPSYLSERFPTEVRAAASAFCYHQGAIFGGLVAPILSYFAINYNLGFGVPMLVGTTAGAISFVIALLLGPETRGKELVPDLVVA